jgi:hypothetical protein
MALATAFLPVLEKVADKLQTFLADPATQAAISELGTNLAEGFDALVEIAGNLPWESIGNAFKLMGQGSKALLDAFVGLPPWVQTAVLTGWGLNKLTGGALTGIVGALASGLIKGILGINAGVVNINAATVTGGPGGGAPVAGGGKPGGGFNPIGWLVGPLAALLIGENIRGGGELTSDVQAIAIVNAIKQGQTVTEATAGRTVAAIREAASSSDLTDTQKAALRKLIGLTQAVDHEANAARLRDRDQTMAQLRNLAAVREGNLDRVRQAANQARQLAGVDGRLATIAGKNFSPKVSVTVTSNVTISEIQRKITSQQIAIGKGPLEFE